MFHYVFVGSNRLKEAVAFYDGLMEFLGVAPIGDHPSGGRMYGDLNGIFFGVVGPVDGKPATIGNGSMITFRMETRDQVDAWYKKALELGAVDDGAPGLRGDPDNHLYHAYVRDLDGNKLSAAKFGPEDVLKLA